ncbi:MAG: nucleotidyltransferase domain-containing protein [Deltaproteobacteria bacterium]|nr:nucleotidyltransferase domain-containing protein [Deltaproteobacteria bacterium]
MKNYANEVRQILPVEKVELYGSYAKGNATKQSDVDVCFFLASFGGEKWIDIMVKLFDLSYKYRSFIEPMGFEVSDLYDDNPFVKEVLLTGIEIE